MELEHYYFKALGGNESHRQLMVPGRRSQEFANVSSSSAIFQFGGFFRVSRPEFKIFNFSHKFSNFFVDFTIFEFNSRYTHQIGL